MNEKEIQIVMDALAGHPVTTTSEFVNRVEQILRNYKESPEYLYLVCILDDEHYTDADYEVYDSMDKAKSVCMDREIYEAFEGTFTINEVKYKDGPSGYQIDYSSGDSSFIVNQIIPIKVSEASHLSVWHHGYNGVDFEIRHMGSYSDCMEAVEKEAKKCYSDNRKYGYYMEYTTYNNQFIVDTGNEWEVWDVFCISDHHIK